MRGAHVGPIKTVKHRSKLTSRDMCPVYSAPYRGVPNSKQCAAKELEKMLQEEVIEPTNKKWSSAIVFASEKDGLLTVCVTDRRLDAVTLRDSYCLPKTDKCVDSLEKSNLLNITYQFKKLESREC